MLTPNPYQPPAAPVEERFLSQGTTLLAGRGIRLAAAGLDGMFCGRHRRGVRAVNPREPIHAVATPEGALLRLSPAGPVARFAASFIDLALLILAEGLSFGLVQPLVGDPGGGLLAILAFLGLWLYGVLFEVLMGGRTPGKRLLGLRVLRTDGLPVTWGPAMLRNLLRVVDGLPLGYTVGYLAVVLNRSFRRVGDLVADTVVVHDPRPPMAVPLPEVPAVPVPVDLTVAEQGALVAFAERSALMNPGRLAELADLLAGLSGVSGEAGVRLLQGMAHTIRGSRS